MKTLIAIFLTVCLATASLAHGRHGSSPYGRQYQPRPYYGYGYGYGTQPYNPYRYDRRPYTPYGHPYCPPQQPYHYYNGPNSGAWYDGERWNYWYSF